MHRNSGYFSFWAHTVYLISLLFTYVIAQDRVSVLKDNSKVLLCEHGAAAIASFEWKKGTTVLISGFISNGQPEIRIDSMPDKTELLLQNGSPNMRLDNIDIGDEGTYSCEATDQGGTLTTLTTELLVRVQPTRPAVQVQYDPQPSDLSSVPLNTTVTFTCTSTGGRPPATLTWSGTPTSVTPTYTSSNDSQGVGDATSTFNFTTTEYGVTYSVYCSATGPDPIQTRTSEETSFKTEPDLSTSTTPKIPTGDQVYGPGAVAGAAVSCFIGGLLVGGAAVFLFLRFRTTKNGGKKEATNLADRQYENVPRPNQRVTSQRPGSGSDEYEVPMETVQPPNFQPPQSSDDYQELRPAVYQSLQKH